MTKKTAATVREKKTKHPTAPPQPKRYVAIWRNNDLTVEAKSIDDMIDALSSAVESLSGLRDRGVVLDGGAEDDNARLVTENSTVAMVYGFTPEEVYED